jgi:hypothetical protein
MRTSRWMTGRVTVAAIVTSGVLHSATLASAPPHRVRDAAPFRCDVVSDHDILAPAARIDTGEYTFTMVAASGASSGASVRGRLWLRRTSALDTSSVPRERALAADTARIPLYGATIIDFSGVGAPVAETASSTVSDPRSFDPMRPGVLVTHRTGKAIGDGRWRLLIGTTANDRRTPCDTASDCPPTPASGSGIALTVRKIEPSGFAGGWAPVGGDGGVRGFFCAVPVRYFGFPYPQRRHIP